MARSPSTQPRTREGSFAKTFPALAQGMSSTSWSNLKSISPKMLSTPKSSRGFRKWSILLIPSILGSLRVITSFACLVSFCSFSGNPGMFAAGSWHVHNFTSWLPIASREKFPSYRKFGIFDQIFSLKKLRLQLETWWSVLRGSHAVPLRVFPSTDQPPKRRESPGIPTCLHFPTANVETWALASDGQAKAVHTLQFAKPVLWIDANCLNDKNNDLYDLKKNNDFLGPKLCV